MPAVVVIAFGWVLTVSVCWSLGRLLLDSLSLRFFRQEEYVFAFVVGSACFSSLMFLLASAGWVHRGVMLALAVLILTLAWWKRAYRLSVESFPPLPQFWSILFYSVYAVYAGLYLFSAFAPEASPDGAGYHLGLARQYLRQHGFGRITTDFHASFPQGMELLFLFAIAFGRFSAAALVHCTFLLLLPLAILNFARRANLAAAGVVGGLIIFTSPIAGLTGTTAYNDAALACVAFSVFALLEVWDAHRGVALLVPAGILAGFAVGIKYTAFPAVLYAFGFVAWRLLRSCQTVWRPLILLSACAAALIVPTLIKNWITVDNPVSPFLNRVFRNEYVHVAFEDNLAENMRNYGVIRSYRQIPLEVTVRGQDLQGMLGPLFLLTPLALLSLGRRDGRRLMATALLFVLPYPANIGTRFLLPTAAFVAPALGLALIRWRAAGAVLAIIAGVSSWPRIAKFYCDERAFRLQPTTLRAVLRKQPEEEYLSARLAGYDAVRMIDRRVPRGGRVFSFSDLPFAYCSREIFPGFYSASNERLRDAMWTAFLPNWQPTAVETFRIAPTAVRKLRIVQTGSGGVDIPSANEVKIFGETDRLGPSPAWRYTASPFPWDAAQAFDGHPITRWRTWEFRRDGMYLEVDFGAPQVVRAVEMEHAHDEWYARYQLHGEIVGQWKLLAASPQIGVLEHPPDYRRLAVDELRRSGIQYVVVQSTDYAAQEFQANAGLWPMRLIEEIKGTRLFLLE